MSHHDASGLSGLVVFDEDVFFQVLLPPIIFSAGFSVKKKLFFRNFFTLIVFGVIGTIWTAGWLAIGSYYAMGAGALPGPTRKALYIFVCGQHPAHA